MKGKIAFIQVLLILTVIICGYSIVENMLDKRDTFNSKEIVSEEYSPGISPDEGDSASDRLRKYNELYLQNSDMAGWIRVSDTAIDYPVMHSVQSNAYYLHRNFNREENAAGIPFLDYQCNPQQPNDNMIIYAHNMKNGTMFHDLLKYKNKEFYATHTEIEFDTLYETGIYEIYAVLHTKVGSENEFKYYDFIDAESAEEFDKFISECISRSSYETGIVPEFGDKLLTLSTCSYNTDNERFVVFARKKNIG